MSDAADALSALTTSNLPTTFFARVAALNEDNTVSLEWGIGDDTDPILGVPASKSYVGRDVGDTVLVQRIKGSLLVTGTASAADVSSDTLSSAVSNLGDSIDALDARVTDIYNNSIPNVSYQATAPSGWQRADSVYYRPSGQPGVVDIMFVRAAETSSPGTKPGASSSVTPSPSTVSPNGRGSWRSNGQTDPGVMQGTWTSSGNWVGGWFYGTSIAAACAGKSVKSMSFTISRASGAGGWNRAVPAHLSLHGSTSKQKPSGLSGAAMHSIKLSPGQKTSYTLTDAWVSALVSGSARGFMISGSGQGDYLTCTSSSGALRIVFQ